ncbi:type II secretion system F family protein [bacterium]|nr:type II secretion system F family protein [bacterium]
MPTYLYKAKTEKGKTEIGISEAESENDLAHILREKGLILIASEIAEVKEKKIESFYKNFLTRFRGIPLKEKMMFAKHLSVMIKAGVSLDSSLQILAKQTNNYKFKKIIEDLSNQIRKGVSFSYALSNYPNVFDNLFVSMVKVGEISGTLEQVLKLLAEQMRKEVQLKSRVKGAMTYPMVILIAMIGIGIFMMVSVVPKLTSTFEELNVKLPLTTKIVIKTANFFHHYLVFGIIFIVISIFCFKLIYKIKKIKSKFHLIYLKLPIFGEIIKKVNSARFARTTSSLIEAGVDLVKTLYIVSDTLTNICFKNSLISAAEQIKKGKAFSYALSNWPDLYPPMVLQMIKVGEETGTLTDSLRTLAEFYEEEVNNITKNLSSIIEPLLMIIIGIAVGFFAISMIQPIYSIMGGI